jgi:hypothetical protein
VIGSGPALGAVADRFVRIVGWIVATALGAVLALYDVGFATLYLHGVRLPVPALLAVVGNPALVVFAYVATGRRAAGIAPALAWCVVWFGAAMRTGEGDWLVLPDNWVGVVTSIVGPVAFAVAIYQFVTWPRRGP